MKAAAGTYALVLKNQSTSTIQIGRRMRVDLQPGYYIYIGSAFGPGGVRARVIRHFRKDKARHWHIDYLREFTDPVFVWYHHSSLRLEHEWAKSLYQLSGISHVQGFGCSDCKCDTHLFYISDKPDMSEFSNLVGTKVKLWQASQRR
jgi:Uri superfamily endonuclease